MHTNQKQSIQLQDVFSLFGKIHKKPLPAHTHLLFIYFPWFVRFIKVHFQTTLQAVGIIQLAVIQLFNQKCNANNFIHALVQDASQKHNKNQNEILIQINLQTHSF